MAWAPGGMRKRIIIGFIVAMVVLVVGSSVAASTPSVCSGCHYIAPSAQGWAVSAHRDVPCVECHAPPGLPGVLYARYRGVRDLAIHVLQRPDQWRVRSSVPSEWCVGCHAEAWEDPLFSLDHPSMQAPCATCHRDSAHVNEKPVYPEMSVAARDVRYGDEVTCAECHTELRMLGADLAADPLPEKPEAPESVGEG